MTVYHHTFEHTCKCGATFKLESEGQYVGTVAIEFKRLLDWHQAQCRKLSVEPYLPPVDYGGFLWNPIEDLRNIPVNAFTLTLDGKTYWRQP